ncbi:MAG: 4-hydroxy-tetrahydrodipicolinate synthase, partial [Gammaproteobacteria bacterium]
FHIDQGTDAIVVAGTTGESATLEHEEHIEVIARACELAGGRIPIIAGTGSNSTAQTVRLSTAVHRLGVAGLLVVTPYYNKPTQHGMIEHYRRIADAVTVPLILYNVPGRTAVDLLPATVVELSRHPNIRGIKDATADLDRVEAIRDGAGADFRLLSGDDETCCEFMLRGGDGVISVTANVAPRAMHDLCAAARAGRSDVAHEIDAKLQPLHRKLFLESNPIPVKWAVSQMGLIGPTLRLPLTELSQVHHADLLSAMDSADVERH